MDRKLLDYLPPVLREVLEFQAVNTANEPEIVLAWEGLERVLANQFLEDADSRGLFVWERELKLSPRDTDPLNDRRIRIKSMWMMKRPYTLPWLRSILQTLCGEGNFSAEIEPGTYELTVKVGLVAKRNFSDVKALLERVSPDNLAINLSQLYNTHAGLGRFTHARLAAYSHHDLRNEVLKNG